MQPSKAAIAATPFRHYSANPLGDYGVLILSLRGSVPHSIATRRERGPVFVTNRTILVGSGEQWSRVSVFQDSVPPMSGTCVYAPMLAHCVRGEYLATVTLEPYMLGCLCEHWSRCLGHIRSLLKYFLLFSPRLGFGSECRLRSQDLA